MADSVAALLSAALARCPPRRGVVDALWKRALVDDAPIGDADRLAAWRVLLGVPPALDEGAVARRVAAVQLDLPNQRVVSMDAARTRQEVPEFKAPAMVERVARLLTFYAKEGYACDEDADDGARATREGVRFKQGINEVVAPFMLLARPPGAVSDGLVMALAARALARFAPRVFATGADEESTALQASLRLFRLLLQYHDPQLCAVLDQYDAVPELYATPWFLTLLARGHDPTVLFPTWDFLFGCVRRPGPAVLHCLAVALLQRHRGAVLDAVRGGAAASDLPMTLTRLAFSGRADARAACAAALDMWADTPLTFRRLLHNVAYSGGPAGVGAGAGAAGGGVRGRRQPIPVSTALLARLEQRLVVKIGVEEVLVGAASRFATRAAAHESHARLAGRKLPRGAAGSAAAASAAAAAAEVPTGWARLLHEDELELPPRYFLVDCRPRAQYEHGGRLPTAFHFDPALFSDPERLETTMAGFEALRGSVHFAVLGCGSLSTWYHAPLPPADGGGSAMGASPAPAPAAAAAAVVPPRRGGGGSGGSQSARVTSPRSREDSAASLILDGDRGSPSRGSAAAGGAAAAAAATPSPCPASTPRDAAAAALDGTPRGGGGGGPELRGGVYDTGVAGGGLLSSHAAAAAAADAADMAAAAAAATAPSSSLVDVDDADDEYLAVRSGLDPLSATEDGDYGAGDATRAVVLLFLQRGFPRVSEVEGGFTALHQHQAHFLDTTLVGHARDACMVCTGGGAARELERLAAGGGEGEGGGGGSGAAGSAAVAQHRASTPAGGVSDGAGAPPDVARRAGSRHAGRAAPADAAAAEGGGADAAAAAAAAYRAATPVDGGGGSAAALAGSAPSAHGGGSALARGVGVLASWFAVAPTGGGSAGDAPSPSPASPLQPPPPSLPSRHAPPRASVGDPREGHAPPRDRGASSSSSGGGGGALGAPAAPDAAGGSSRRWTNAPVAAEPSPQWPVPTGRSAVGRAANGGGSGCGEDVGEGDDAGGQRATAKASLPVVRPAAARAPPAPGSAGVRARGIAAPAAAAAVLASSPLGPGALGRAARRAMVDAGVVDGFDPLLGLPMFSELAQLEMQCDELERRHDLVVARADPVSADGAPADKQRRARRDNEGRAGGGSSRQRAPRAAAVPAATTVAAADAEVAALARLPPPPSALPPPPSLIDAVGDGAFASPRSVRPRGVAAAAAATPGSAGSSSSAERSPPGPATPRTHSSAAGRATPDACVPAVSRGYVV